jgi:hypothetical protein
MMKSLSEGQLFAGDIVIDMVDRELLDDLATQLSVAVPIERRHRKLSTCMRHQRQGITGQPPLCRVC